MKKFSIFLLIFLVLSTVSIAKADKIISVNIEGTLRTDKETLLSVINTKTGEELSLKKIDEDILNIYDLGFYKTVSAYITKTENGDILTFKVKEKPSVRYIIFEGNDEISDKNLQKALKIKPYNILNKKLIEETISNMLGMYAGRGMYLTRITYSLKKQPNNRVDIIFHIKESKETVIRDINIIGNKHLSISELKDGLKNHVKKGPYILTWLPWFYTGKLRIDALESDRQKIIDKYLSRGFLDVNVSEPIVNIEPDTGIIHIDISIKEGPKYTLKYIKFKNTEPYKPKELLKALDMEIGKPFNMVKLREGIEKITDMYGDKGYAFADVNPVIKKDKKNHTAGVTLIVDKGPKVSIARIEITGNVRTHDNVIRRELLLKEGDIYSTSKIAKSKRNLINLNFFENVKIETKKAGAKKLKMIVHVKEKRTGMLKIGAGYGSYTKFSVMGSIAESNLFGTGIHGKLSANISSKSSYFDLSLVNPWWHNRPIAVGVDIFHHKFDNYDYESTSTGIAPSISERFWEQTLTVGLKYSLTREKITLDTDDPGYYLEQEKGTHVESALIPFVTYNTLDNYIFPTTGVNASITTRLAGFGGDRKYIKGVIFGEYFHPLFWDLIGHIKGEAGSAWSLFNKRVPVNRRFYLGGIDNLRGFEEGKVSPKDNEDNYIGGTKEFYSSAEIIFPIFESLHFYGVVFGDVGNSWSSSYGNTKKDAGFEMRWISPLGPIRVSIGKNLSKKDGEKSTVFLFSMGALF